MTKIAFSSLPLSAGTLANIKSLDYQVMTPIQAQSLPAILQGKDILAQAKTGSGKTAAFAIGLLHKLEARTYRTQALVLCPTRELADQVSNEIRRLARATPNTQHPTPNTQHPTPNTQHPTPNTQHPTPKSSHCVAVNR